MGNKTKTSTDGVDKRKFKRMPTLFSGNLVDGGRSVDVVVLDVSVNGAKIRIPEQFECCPTVKLRIDRLGVFPAEVIWRKGNRLGLKFVDGPDKIASSMPGSFVDKLSRKPHGPRPSAGLPGETTESDEITDP